MDKEKVQKRIKRWKEECFKPYEDLSDEMKEFDRIWARKALKIVDVMHGDRVTQDKD